MERRCFTDEKIDKVIEYIKDTAKDGDTFLIFQNRFRRSETPDDTDEAMLLDLLFTLQKSGVVLENEQPTEKPRARPKAARKKKKERVKDIPTLF